MCKLISYRFASSLVCLFSAPGPPSNVTLDSVSQHSIMVYIAQPLPPARNGVIRGYTVLYRLTSLTEADYLSVNTTSSPVTLTNLSVFTEYSIQAAAFTSAGLGTTSEVKTAVTQEGGKTLDQFVLLDLFNCVNCDLTIWMFFTLFSISKYV